MVSSCCATAAAGVRERDCRALLLLDAVGGYLDSIGELSYPATHFAAALEIPCWNPYFRHLSIVGRLTWTRRDPGDSNLCTLRVFLALLLHTSRQVVCAEALLPLAITAVFTTGGPHNSEHAKWGESGGNSHIRYCMVRGS